MDQLLPDQLKALWQCVERKELLTEEFNLMQERGLAEYRKIWSDALLLEGYRIRQISSYGRRFVFIQHDGRNHRRFRRINSDYEKHSRAVRAIAEEYFRAESVLANVLKDLGL